MRIAFLGDSLTWGGYGGNFVDEVEALLPEHTIINMGRGGDTVVNLLNRLDDVVDAGVDGVVIMIGGNDAISYSQPATRGYYRWTGGAPPDGRMTVDLFTRSFREVLTQLQLAHLLVWVALPPLEYNPTTVEAMRDFNAHMREIAESLNIPVLDLMAELTPASIPDRPPLSQQTINLIGQREKEGWSDYEGDRTEGGFTYSFDGIHFTPETAKIVAGKIVEFLNL